MEIERERVRQQLAKERLGQVFRATYENLLQRIESTGYFEESITGAYGGEFTRSAGSLVFLLIETGEAALARRVLKFVFDYVEKQGLGRIPHVIAQAQPNGARWCSNEDQIDGRAHNVAAFARLCLACPSPAFEERYYPLARREVMAYFEQPYFYYRPGMEVWASTGLGLVFNCSLEHSREGRRWAAFDLLTQAFVGAAGEAMCRLAYRRGDSELAAFLKERLDALRRGVANHLTRVCGEKTIYLEMLLPDGNWGTPYTGMGWVNYGPVAAQWEPLEHPILVNTVEELRRQVDTKDNETGLMIQMLEVDPHSGVNTSVIGKYMGWDIDYCRKQGEWDRILTWCKFLEKIHGDGDILMEQAIYHEGRWKKLDCGNGEQCIWFCWAVSRLCKELSVPLPEKERKEHMEKKKLGWLSLSRNTKGPRYIVDEAGHPVNLFGMARCQIHTLDETRDIGDIHTLCRHYRALGCNAIRLSFSKFRIEEPGRDFIEECGGYTPEGIRTFIEQYVEPDVRAIIEEGLYVVLDLHEYPPNDDHNDPNPAYLIQYAREHYFPIWREMARFYKDEPGIAMYELWNEPYAADQGTLCMGDDGYIRGGKYNNFDWNHHVRQFFIDCAAIVREEDERHMLLVSDYNAGWGCGWAMTWLGHTGDVDSRCRNTLFSIHAASEHLGPRIEFFDGWWAAVCRENNVCIQFGEIETEGELMTPEAMKNLVEMFRRRENEYHYSGFLWRPHTDEENYVALWKDFAREYTGIQE